jgi:hypothetical protein
MPPALDRAPRRRRPRQRPNARDLRSAALSAPSRPLARTPRPPRVTQVRHAAVRASHFVPGLAQASQPKPLQARPPRHPVGARKPGFSTPHRREVEQVARGMLHEAPKPKPKQERPRSHPHALAPRNVYGGQAKGRAGRGGAIATSSGGTGLLSPPSTLLPGPRDEERRDRRRRGPEEADPEAAEGHRREHRLDPRRCRTVRDGPEGAVKNIASDYSRRYGPL